MSKIYDMNRLLANLNVLSESREYLSSLNKDDLETLILELSTNHLSHFPSKTDSESDVGKGTFDAETYDQVRDLLNNDDDLEIVKILINDSKFKKIYNHHHPNLYLFDLKKELRQYLFILYWFVTKSVAWIFRPFITIINQEIDQMKKELIEDVNKED